MASLVRIQRPLLATVFSAIVLFGACSQGEPQIAAVGLGGGTPRAVGGPCSSGQAEPCSITLSNAAGALECYHGTQQCVDGRWGECGNGVVREQAAPAPGARALALSDPAECINNPCNPYCRWYDEVPEPPLDAVDADATPFTWDTGSLANLPRDAVQTGLNQPCATGSDCQFNTRCENPSSGSCAHSVCQSGIALTANCSECAALVHEVAEANPAAYGQCFSAPEQPVAEACVHDPCAPGAALKASCSSAVAQLCADAAYASCCSNTWDGACVTRFRNLNPNVCHCGPGEVAHNGQCLFYNGAGMNWFAARDTCGDRGYQWKLASLVDKNENDFVFDTWGTDPSDARRRLFWLGLQDIWSDGTWSWISSSSLGSWNQSTGAGGLFVNWCGPKGPPGGPACPGGNTEPGGGSDDCAAVMGGDGTWRSGDCGEDVLPSLCKGPPLHSDLSPVPPCPTSAEYFRSWSFLNAATRTQNHTFDVTSYVITVVARGDYAGGAWPTMQLSVNGVVVGTASVNDSGWKSYTFNYTSPVSGNLPIAISYLNDWSDATSDRNFYINSISVQCAGGTGTPSWGSECIGIAESTCDVSCNAERTESGVCVPWLPGDTAPNCPNLADLALGVPCAGMVPVCNHGQVEAPPQVRVVHFPESAQQFGSSDPDLGSSEMVTCTTTAAIPPGQCISLSENDCVDAQGEPAVFSGTRHMMVNPPGGAALPECSGLDNWSIHVDDIECGAPACFGGSTAATSVRRPVDIVFVIDNSGSMREEIFEVEQRINNDFASIIEQSGLDYRVIMVSRYGDLDTPFGSGGGTSYPICIRSPLGGTDCSDPNNQVPVPGTRFFHYSARVGSHDALCLLLDGFSAPDELNVQNRPNWVVQAPSGFGAWLRPEAFKTFVVITDDNVDCETSGGLEFDDGPSVAAGQTVGNDFDSALRQMAPGQFETEDGERKYIWHSIVNIQENTPPDQPWPPSSPVTTNLCSAPGDFVGPGTGYQALSRLSGGLRYPSCRTSDFDAVFTAIAEEVIDVSAASCDFELNDKSLDLTSAVVSYTSSDDSRLSLSQVADASDCAAGGWYLAAGGDNGQVSLCPTTCAEVQADPGAQVFVEIACDTQYAEVSHNQVYMADCEAGSIVEWKALGYDTTVEADGVVRFEVRTAHAEDELNDAEYRIVNTASALAPDCYYLEPMQCVPDDADCNCVPTSGQPGGVAGGVVLGGDKLSALEAREPYLELRMTLVPTSDGASAPTVDDWRVAYSCLPGE